MKHNIKETIIWSLNLCSAHQSSFPFIPDVSMIIQHIYQWLWKFLTVKPIIVFAWSTSWFDNHYLSETTANMKTYIYVGLLWHNMLVKSQSIFDVTP